MVSFGSSGIRGIFGKDITPDLFLDLGRAVASRYKRIVLGRDVRLSGKVLSSAFISGALSSGSTIDDGGMVSTPTIAFSAREYDCGVVVTASHNPPEYNGIKFWNSNGIAFNQQQQTEIEETVHRRTFEIQPWDRIFESNEREDLAMNHSDAIINKTESINLKVVIDCGCGATSNITPYVLREIGCKVIALNAQPDGHFPGRMPEPTEENLELLRKTVLASKSDLGIAHDGDGDRVVAVDEKGNYIGGEKLLLLFAQKTVKKSLVVPVDASMAIDDILPEAKIFRTRVGDVYVAQEILRHKADFGGEPSGTFIFPSWGLFPDGVYGAVYIATLATKEKLSTQIERLPTYPSKSTSINFEESKRLKVVESLSNALSTLQGVEIDTTDGWRVKYEDGWGLVRLSGTEPKVRVFAEARDENRTKELYESLISKVKVGLK